MSTVVYYSDTPYRAVWVPEVIRYRCHLHPGTVSLITKTLIGIVCEMGKHFCEVKAKQCFPLSKHLTNRNKDIKQEHCTFVIQARFIIVTGLFPLLLWMNIKLKVSNIFHVSSLYLGSNTIWIKIMSLLSLEMQCSSMKCLYLSLSFVSYFHKKCNLQDTHNGIKAKGIDKD